MALLLRIVFRHSEASQCFSEMLLHRPQVIEPVEEEEEEEEEVEMKHNPNDQSSSECEEDDDDDDKNTKRPRKRKFPEKKLPVEEPEITPGNFKGFSFKKRVTSKASIRQRTTDYN